MEKVFEQMRDTGIIPVIKIDKAEHAVPLAKALIAGGISIAEVTYRTNAAEEAIRCILSACPDMLVGAGTVTSKELAESAINAGAKFIVAPGFNPSVVDYCLARNVPIIPGVSSPTQIEESLNRNLTVLKFFPAEMLGGVKMLEAFAGPFNQTLFVPTGGINTDNLGDYAKCKNVLAVGGTWIVKSETISEEKWDTITASCKEALLKIQGFTLGHVGINAGDADEAQQTAESLSLFGFPISELPVSFFCGTEFEVMKANGRGTHGHIGFMVNNIERSLWYLSRLGYKPVMETAQYIGEKEKSPLKFIYLDKPIGGFAVHLKRK